MEHIRTTLNFQACRRKLLHFSQPWQLVPKRLVTNLLIKFGGLIPLAQYEKKLTTSFHDFQVDRKKITLGFGILNFIHFCIIWQDKIISFLARILQQDVSAPMVAFSYFPVAHCSTGSCSQFTSSKEKIPSKMLEYFWLV